MDKKKNYFFNSRNKKEVKSGLNEIILDEKTINSNRQLLIEEDQEKRENEIQYNRDQEISKQVLENEFEFIHSSIKKELNLIVENIENNENAIICLTGKSFEYILKYYMIENKNKMKDNMYGQAKKEFSIFTRLTKLIKTRAKIFSRMLPFNNVELINLLKEDDINYVAMCGDKVKDYRALLTADVGISINHKIESNITSHFYCSHDSISSIEIILKYGRTCNENSLIIIKNIIISGSIKACSVLLQEGHHDIHFNFVIDFVVFMITSLLIMRLLI